MKNKEKVILLISGVILLLVAATFFSYSYFAVNNTVTNNLVMNINVEGGDAGVFTVNKGTNIQMNVLSADMLDTAGGTAAATANTSLTVKLTSSNNIKCSYDIYWVWNTGTNAYTKTSGATKEFTIAGTSSSLSMAEKQISNSSTSLKLGTYEISANNTTTTQVWNFTARFYNLNLNQDAHAEKKYSGKVDIPQSGVTCGGI